MTDTEQVAAGRGRGRVRRSPLLSRAVIGRKLSSLVASTFNVPQRAWVEALKGLSHCSQIVVQFSQLDTGHGMYHKYAIFHQRWHLHVVNTQDGVSGRRNYAALRWRYRRLVPWYDDSFCQPTHRYHIRSHKYRALFGRKHRSVSVLVSFSTFTFIFPRSLSTS